MFHLIMKHHSALYDGDYDERDGDDLDDGHDHDHGDVDDHGDDNGIVNDLMVNMPAANEDAYPVICPYF